MNPKINAWIQQHKDKVPAPVMNRWLAIVRAYQNPTLDNLLAAINDDRQRAETKVLAAAKGLLKLLGK